MNKIKINLTPRVRDEHYYNYPEPYKYIAGFMKSRLLWDIGNPDYREKFRLPNGDIRSASMDMDIDSRAARTINVRKLTEDQLRKAHALEQRRLFFLYGPQIFKAAGAPYRPEPVSREAIEAVIELNNSNRPAPRKIGNVSIPPYFQLDLEFDGMIYHQQWDWLVHSVPFDMPVMPAATRKRASATL